MDDKQLLRLEQEALEKEFGFSGTETPHRTSNNGIETPDGIVNIEILQQELEKFLPNTSVALKLMLAVATSGVRNNPVMLWLLFIGSPSSGKTELLKLIKKIPHVISLDTLTQNSFISGERETDKQKVYDLLKELDRKCLIVKDWTAVLSQDERMTKKILGDLTGVYDGSFEKFSSARGKISYDAEFSHLGAITPATLNRHHNYLNMIGPRFLFYTIPSLSKEEENKSFDTIFSKENRKEAEERLSTLVFNYLVYLNESQIVLKPLNDEVKTYLKLAARFVARGRGIVILQKNSFVDEGSKEVTYYEPQDIQIEQPFRAIQQLISLAEYLAFVGGKKTVGLEELEIIKEVVISSMPADRSQALRVLLATDNGEITAQQLKDQSDKSIKTARRLLDELTHLGLVEKVKGTGQLASTYKIADEFKNFILRSTREFLSPYSSNKVSLNSSGISSNTPQPSLEQVKEIFSKETK